MRTIPTSTPFVDAPPPEQTATAAASAVDLPGAHEDVNRFQRQRANRLGHVCRDCRNPDCVGEQRDEHELAFAQAESSALLNASQYFACPGCGQDTRYAPACRPAVP